jgi:hypothetical protein
MNFLFRVLVVLLFALLGVPALVLLFAALGGLCGFAGGMHTVFHLLKK